MDLRTIIMCLLLSFTLFKAHADTSELTMATLDELNIYLHQYPSKAIKRIAYLESLTNKQQVSDLIKLRLTLLKCDTLIELGENQAAINLAKMGDAQAKLLKLEQARPYFLNCLADAHTSYDNLKTALPLFDSAMQLARRYQQPQALINTLRLRGQIDTDTENFTSAIEDLRLAVDLLSELESQPINWSWPPSAYVYAAMGNLMYSSGDLKQAIYYGEIAYADPSTLGKIKHVILLNMAIMALANGDTAQSDLFLEKAKEQIPSLDSDLDLAMAYSTISVIDLHRKRISSAKRLALMSRTTFEKQKKLVLLMRNNRQLAQIAFAQENQAEALDYMKQAIDLGMQLYQPTDLAEFYQILADNFAKQNDFENAFNYRTKQNEAISQANDKLSNARFIQYKARLSQHSIENTQVTQSLTKDSLNAQNKLNWAYGFIIILCLILVFIVVLSLIKQQGDKYIDKQLNSSDKDNPTHRLENLLSNAKQANYPLALVLMKTTHIRQVDLPQLLDHLKVKLREQDEVIRHNLDEVMIVLPYTSPQGAEFVIEQLISTIQPWQPNHKVQMGLAGLQQFDTIQSLIKRANANQLNKLKTSDNKPKVEQPVETY